MAWGGLTSKGGKLKALIFNDKNYITMKKKMIYDAPDAELTIVRFEQNIMSQVNSTSVSDMSRVDADIDW